MKGEYMEIREFFRKLGFEINRREEASKFVAAEFYFPTEQEEIENLEVGETHVSVTAQLQAN